MGIVRAIEIHEECYSADYISKLSYTEAWQMIGACESEKDCRIVCSWWNQANPNAVRELSVD